MIYRLIYDDELHKAAKVAAARKGISLKDLIVSGIENEVKKEEKSNDKNILSRSN